MYSWQGIYHVFPELRRKVAYDESINDFCNAFTMDYQLRLLFGEFRFGLNPMVSLNLHLTNVSKHGKHILIVANVGWFALRGQDFYKSKPLHAQGPHRAQEYSGQFWRKDCCHFRVCWRDQRQGQGFRWSTPHASSYCRNLPSCRWGWTRRRWLSLGWESHFGIATRKQDYWENIFSYLRTWPWAPSCVAPTKQQRNPQDSTIFITGQLLVVFTEP